MTGTPRQLAALRAYVTHGGVKQAAHALGVSERQMHRYLEAIRTANGCTSMQAAYLLGQDDAPFQQMQLRLVA